MRFAGFFQETAQRQLEEERSDECPLLAQGAVGPYEGCFVSPLFEGCDPHAKAEIGAERAEGIEAPGALERLRGFFRPVQKTMDPTSHRPGAGIVRIEKNRPLYRGFGSRHVAAIGDRKRSSRHREGIFFSICERQPREPRGFGKAALVFRFGPALSDLHDMRISGERCRRSVKGIYIERLPSKTDRLRPAVLAHVMELSQRAEEEVIRIHALGRFARGALDLRLAQLWCYRADDARCEPVLQFEDIVERAIEMVGPDMRTCAGIDQLPGDAHAISGLSHAAFQYVAHAELARHLLHIDGFAFVGEARIARDDE